MFFRKFIFPFLCFFCFSFYTQRDYCLFFYIFLFMFIDEVGLTCRAGNGGNGIVSWRRVKYIPK